MVDHKAAFETFAAGYAAAYAAGFADAAAYAREEDEHRSAEWLDYAIESGEEDIRDHIDIGYGPGQWYEDEGEWIQVPEFPGQADAQRNAEEAAARRRYDADVAEGQARFVAASTVQDKHGYDDFSLDLLSAFATAYAIGFGGGHCASGLLPRIFSEDGLYDAAGVPPYVKAALIAAYEAERTASLLSRWQDMSEEGKIEAEQKIPDVTKNAAEVGFVSWELQLGNEACRTYDAGYSAGEESAYTVARQAAYDAVLAICNGNTDVAEQVANAIIAAAPSHIAHEESERRRRTEPQSSSDAEVLLSVLEKLQGGRPLLARAVREANQHRRAMQSGPPLWGAYA